MGRCTFGLVFSNILLFIACLAQLFRNIFHSYRYNLLLRLLEPVIECCVWNVVANTERVDGYSFGFTLGLVNDSQLFKRFRHNLGFKLCCEDNSMEGFCCQDASFEYLRMAGDGKSILYYFLHLPYIF